MTIDHFIDAPFLVIPVTPYELLSAARLGGLNIPLDAALNHCTEAQIEEIQDCARYGVLAAIHHCSEGQQPHCDPLDIWDGLSLSGTTTGSMGKGWNEMPYTPNKDESHDG